MKTKRLFLTAVAAVCCMILSLSVTSCASDIADNPVDGPVVVPIVGQGEEFEWNYFTGSGRYKLYFSITSEPTEEDPGLPFEVCMTKGSELSLNCNVDIPAIAKHNGQDYSVTAIGDRAFDCEREQLSSVAIPASVKSIGEDVFFSCKSLTSVSFADNAQLETIGESAFQGCTSLETITLPASVKTIGWWAFDGCTSLKTVYLNSDPEILRGAFPDGVEVVYLNHDN